MFELFPSWSNSTFFLWFVMCISLGIDKTEMWFTIQWVKIVSWTPLYAVGRWKCSCISTHGLYVPVYSKGHHYCMTSTLLNVFECHHPDSQYNSHCTMVKSTTQNLHATTCFRTVCMFTVPFLWTCTMFIQCSYACNLHSATSSEWDNSTQTCLSTFFQGPSIATHSWFHGRKQTIFKQTIITWICTEVVNFSICCYTVPTSYPMGIGGSFARGKVARAWR
jgi:hypothetical protein